MVLVGCGARSGLDDPPSSDAGTDAGSRRRDAGPRPGRDAGPPPRDAGPPPACVLPSLRACDFDVAVERVAVEPLVGEPTVLEDLEVLDDGTVVAGGYFGVLRSRDGGASWEHLAAPLPLGSSFLELRHRGTELWAVAFGDVAWTPDAGDTWEVLSTGMRFVSQLFPLPDGRVALGGDNVFGVMEAPLGPIVWVAVDALDGDRGTYFENNTIFGLQRSGPYLVAAERFGGVARAGAVEGPWELVSRAGGDPELLSVEAYGVLLMRPPGGTLLVSCDQGESWGTLGESPAYAAASAGSTQLALAFGDVLVAPGLDGIGLSCDLGQTWTSFDPSLADERLAAHDAAVAPDGSVWIAANAAMYRLSW